MRVGELALNAHAETRLIAKQAISNKIVLYDAPFVLHFLLCIPVKRVRYGQNYIFLKRLCRVFVRLLITSIQLRVLQ